MEDLQGVKSAIAPFLKPEKQKTDFHETLQEYNSKIHTMKLRFDDKNVSLQNSLKRKIKKLWLLCINGIMPKNI